MECIGNLKNSISSSFIWRRVHSLLGLWLVLYLFEHLLVNSQAALWIGDEGNSFVRLVNLIQALPYLHFIEAVFIGIPLLLHGIWGIKRLFEAKENADPSDGSTPSLPYLRNRAYGWQRITSWILLFGIAAHVVQMRFLGYPTMARVDHQERAFVELTYDKNLPALADRLGVTLQQQSNEQKVVASAPSPGAAMLLMVRNTFKQPLMIALYTIFVLAAAFHATNGFWTFLITWGVILSYPSQRVLAKATPIGILLLAFLGLAAIWSSYFL
jgi:succinate dehydrogenase / fumarate reductase cytochrome b subunit